MELPHHLNIFAAENAVILRNGKTIKGPENIYNYYINNSIYNNYILVWKPTFIDVSEGGDMAYTYGEYYLTYNNTKNETISSSGIFHTVWKKK